MSSKEVPQRQLRSTSTSHWLVGPPLSEITGLKLPTNKIVLRRFLLLREIDKLGKKRHLGDAMFCELGFWEMAKLPMKRDNHCVDQLLELYEDYMKLKAYSIPRKETKLFIDKIEKFEFKLQDLFDISHSNTYEILKFSRNEEWEQDWMFLQGQRKVPQEGSMSTVQDNNLHRKEKRSNARQEALAARSAFKKQFTQQHSTQIESFESSEDDYSDQSFDIPQQKRAKTVSLNIPRSHLASLTGQVADRNGISVR
jgi:hypothetical protein